MQQDRKTCTEHVTQTIAMECVDVDGLSMTLAAELGYCPDDPYAVTATFKSPGGDVLWTFARDLLARGLTDPVGDGDVHVWPCLDTSGRAVVIVELHSPEGELLVQGSTHEITRFVNRTLAAVPAGLESDRVDVDQLIDQLLGA